MLLGQKHTKEWREKIGFKKGKSPWNYGKKNWMSEEGKKSMIASKKGRPTWNKGKKGVQVPWNKSKKGLQTAWNKGLKGFRVGEKNPRWIKDRTKLNPKLRIYKEAIEWRNNIYKRDNWKCRISNQDCKGRLEAHHILRWAEYPELRYEVNNGITLCHFHHPRKRKDEVKLSPYFQELIKV